MALCFESDSSEHFLKFPDSSILTDDFRSISFYDTIGNECLDDLDPESLNNEFNLSDDELVDSLKSDHNYGCDNELFNFMAEVCKLIFLFH